MHCERVDKGLEQEVVNSDDITGGSDDETFGSDFHDMLSVVMSVLLCEGGQDGLPMPAHAGFQW